MKSALTGHCHTNDGAQTAVQQKRLSDLPAVHVSERTEPLVSQLNGDRATETVKWFNNSSSALEVWKAMATGETIFLLERRTLNDGSLSFPKDPQEQKHGVQDSGHSGDLIFG